MELYFNPGDPDGLAQLVDELRKYDSRVMLQEMTVERYDVEAAISTTIKITLSNKDVTVAVFSAIVMAVYKYLKRRQNNSVSTNQTLAAPIYLRSEDDFARLLESLARPRLEPHDQATEPSPPEEHK